MPCRRALPERVAFGSLSTELGDVKICLNACERIIMNILEYQCKTYHNKEGTAEQTIPRILRIIVIAMVEEYGPLISSDDHLP